MILRSLSITLLIVSLAACALSPQYVEIDPDIKISQQIDTAHITALTIYDKRPENQLGTRGGVYAQTSFIYPSQPLTESLKPAALHALQQLGLATEGLSPNPLNVSLNIDELSYTADSSTLPIKVTLNCRISIEIDKMGSIHKGNFKSSKTHSYLKSPNEEENKKIINEIVSDTMTRVLNDQKLINFVNNR